jgi:hypothetical protein
MEELNKVIELLEKWAVNNEIAVNKKKKEVLDIDNKKNDMSKYRG